MSAAVGWGHLSAGVRNASEEGKRGAALTSW